MSLVDKEKLLQKLLDRKLHWLNQQRLKALKTLEKKSKNKVLKPSQILEAFFGTLLDMLDEKDYGGEMFLRLLGRSSLEPNCLISSISNGKVMLSRRGSGMLCSKLCRMFQKMK